MGQEKSELRGGKRVDRDVPIAMHHGLVLRAEMFRPAEASRYPAILTRGPGVAPARTPCLPPIIPPKGFEP